MAPRSGSPPYFDRLLQRMAAADPDAQAAFGRHVHWGYWDEPEQAGTSVEEYGRAAESLCLKLLNYANLQNGQRILDVGCGFGGTIACLNERHSHLQMFGLNIDLHQLQRAAEQTKPRSGNTVQLVVSDAAELSIADEGIDAALAVECVFHFDRPRFFAEISRVLRSGGTLTLSDFVPEERAVPYIEAMNVGGNEAVRSTYGVIDISWSVERYRQLAAKHGLVLSETHDITIHTLPTYDFLRKSVDRWTDEADGKRFLQATGLLAGKPSWVYHIPDHAIRKTLKNSSL